MKRVLSLLLIFFLQLHIFSGLGLLAYFKANQDYIARILCINRDKPVNHCQGKCYLVTKLKTQQQSADNVAHIQKIQQEVLLFIAHAANLVPEPLRNIVTSQGEFYQLAFYPAALSACFRPPKN